MMRFGEHNDVEQLMMLQEKVYDNAPKSQLSMVEREDIEEAIDKSHLVVAGDFAGFRMLHVPEDDYIGAAVNDKRRVIYYDISIVDPAQRGQGLQTMMGQFLYEEVIKDSEYDWVLCTVHPDNIASMKDKFKLGMHITYLDEFYGGKERFVFAQELADIQWAGDEVTIERSDRAQLKEMLGKGYKGKKLDENLNIVMDTFVILHL